MIRLTTKSRSQTPAGNTLLQNSDHGAGFMDGEHWIIDGRNKYTPKNGAVCVVSNGSGSYLKVWDKPLKAFVSITPKFPDPKRRRAVLASEKETSPTPHLKAV